MYTLLLSATLSYQAFPARVISFTNGFAVVATVESKTGILLTSKVFDHQLLEFITDNNIVKDFNVYIIPKLGNIPSSRSYNFRLMKDQ